MNRALLILLLASGSVRLPAAQKSFVEARVDRTSMEAMSILRVNCLSCHGDDKKKGGLRLTTRENALKGGESGPALVPRKPGESLLAKFVRPDSDPHMPPKKQLSEKDIATLCRWIANGAGWDAQALAASGADTKPVSLVAMPASYQPVLALALSPDEKRLVVGRANRICVYDLSRTNRPVIGQLEGHRDAVQSLAWSRDGKRLASGGFRRIVVWDMEALRPQQSITNNLVGRITALQFTPDDATLLAADGVPTRSGIVHFISVAEGKSRFTLAAHQDSIYALRLSPDGNLLATAGADKLVKLWDRETRKEIGKLEAHMGHVLALAFKPDGEILASSGADKVLNLWDVKTRKQEIVINKHPAPVTALAWAQEGKSLWSVCEDGSPRLFTDFKLHSGAESSDGARDRTFGGVGELLYGLAAAADGKTLFAGGQEGSVYVWNNEGKLQGKLALPEAAGSLAAQGTEAVPRLVPAASVADQPGLATRAAGPTTRSSSAQYTSIAAFPETITMPARRGVHRILVTGLAAGGIEDDLTARATFDSSRPAVAVVTREGLVRARSPGSTVIKVRVNRQTVSVPVQVEPAPAAAPLGFLHDVLPVLSKAGCNAGSCHAKPDGQNGFKLSVFAYDPVSDYRQIVKADRGRRVFPASPEESLILKKPTLGIEHEGGQRFEIGSESHQTVLSWIRQGMVFSLTNEPTLVEIKVYPRERRYQKGVAQALLVQARYTDGAVRDVTDLAEFVSNEKEMARVDERGVVKVGTLSGEGVVIARFMGLVDTSRITVPTDKVLPDSLYAALPVNNEIDRLVYARLKPLGLAPSAGCTDGEFLRRASLDAVGTLPTAAQVREFLADASVEKRDRFIDRLLEQPAYGDHWAVKWGDLIRPNPSRVGVKPIYLLDLWLRESFRQNKPYDQFVRELLTAQGSTHQYGPAALFRDKRDPADASAFVSQIFLGVRMECARCHHHPNEKWAQSDYYQLAAFFGQVKRKGQGISAPISGEAEFVWHAPGGEVKHPVTGEIMKPKPPDGAPAGLEEDGDPRAALAEWMTRTNNPFFARAIANRIWAQFMGRGIVEPVDDFRASNPATNEPLLDWLAQDFVGHGYNLKHLMRTIMRSHVYQLASSPNEHNVADTRNFSRAYRRRLPAEVLLDAVSEVTGTAETFSGLPPGSRALETWNHKLDSEFMDAFGRPNSSSECPCERDARTSVVQALHLMNSNKLQSKIASSEGRARHLADSKLSDAEIVAELYLAAYGRLPDREEAGIVLRAFSAKDAVRKTAIEDLMWALINSAEFVFNH